MPVVITLSQAVYVQKSLYDRMSGPPEIRLRGMTLFTLQEIEDAGGDLSDYIEVRTHDTDDIDLDYEDMKAHTRLTNALASVVERVADVAVGVIAAAQKGVPQ